MDIDGCIHDATTCMLWETCMRPFVDNDRPKVAVTPYLSECPRFYQKMSPMEEREAHHEEAMDDFMERMG